MSSSSDIDMLSEAARYLDAHAEEGGIEHAARQAGLNINAATHVAEQRAMRLAIFVSRGPEALRELARMRGVQTIEMSDEERMMMELLTTAALDAIFIGWLASGISRSGDA